MTEVVNCPASAGTVSPASRTVQMPQMRRIAPVKSYNPETRMLQVMWGAGAQVLRFDWWEGEYFTEELDMSTKACDLSRLNSGAPVLDTHQSYELENVLGVVDRAWLQNGEGWAEIRLSSREDLAWLRQDVADGVIRNVSVGYMVNAMEQAGFDESTGFARMVVTDWQPFEISLVPVGADAAAGTRAQPTTRTTACVVRSLAATPAAPAAQRQESTMDAVKEGSAAGTQAADIKIVQDQARNAEQARIREIVAIGRQFDAVAEADQFVDSGASVESFRAKVMDIITERNKQQAPAVRDINMSDKEVRSYSLMRAVRAMVEGDWSKAGFEREMSQNFIAKNGVIPSSERSFFIPHEVQTRLMIPAQLRAMARSNPHGVEALVRQMMARDLTSGTGNAGGFLVATDNLAGSFIDLLRARALVMQLGARTLPGLQGNVTIPRQTAAATAYWLANEATAITESQLTLGQLSLTPKTVGAYTELSRLLMLQSSPAADMLAMEDLVRVIALAVDAAALNGSGASGQPTGIIGTAGIGSVTGTSLAYAGIVEFQTDVAGANALTTECAYVTTPTIAGTLKTRQRFASTDTPLWQGNILDGTVEGFRASSTTQMPSAALLFGDFSQVIVAEWGTLEIDMSPYANFPAGISGIRAMATIDIGVRVAGGFSYASSIT